MNLFHRVLGRREFISVTSVALGAGMITKPFRMVFAADMQPKSSGNTKYGKYILSGYDAEIQDPIRGTFVAKLGSDAVPDAPNGNFVRMPPPGPMPEHGGSEAHPIPVYLMHLGNDPEDPMDLGAEAHLYLGKGEDLEKHVITKSTAVFLPAGTWHCPWQVKKVWKPMTFIDLGHPGAVPSGASKEDLAKFMEAMEKARTSDFQYGNAMGPSINVTEEYLAKAKTSGFKYDKLLLSGVSKEVKEKDPSGGRMIAYVDCTILPGAWLTRIIRFQPKDAPFPRADFSKHKYESVLIHLGTDYDDPFDLGAEVEFHMGEEKERHVFNQSTVVYIPPNMEYGPWEIKKISKPFNFLQVVMGPETPVKI